MPGSIEDALKAGSEAADSIGKLGNASPTHFNQIISLCLLASMVALAAYEFTMGRPQVVNEFKGIADQQRNESREASEQARQEFKAINDSNLSRFESILGTQQRSHEKVVEMITGGKLKLSSTLTDSASGTN